MDDQLPPDNNGSYQTIIIENGTELKSTKDVQQWAQKELHNWMGLSENDQLDISFPEKSKGNYKFYRIEQKHHGIPVIGLEATLLTFKGKPDYILGRNHAINNIRHKPSITEQQAINNSKVITDKKNEINLVYWRKSKSDITLSYEITGTFEYKSGTRDEKVYVNAVNGKIHNRVALEYSSIKRHIVDVESACRDLGINRPVSSKKMNKVLDHAIRNFSRKEGDAPTGIETTDYFYDLMGSAYIFLKTTYNMDSLNDSGMYLNGIGRIRFNQHVKGIQCTGNDFNAFWNGHANALFVPDSAIKYTEVVAHELAHGIVSNGSNLVYQDQSGALNEAIADAIGVTFRAWLESGGNENNAVTKINTRRGIWKLRSPRGILRDMKTPKNADPKLPDHMSSYVYTSRDHGGVHINSSIINQAFYILSKGGKHPRRRTGSRVKGIGIKKASQIFALAASHILTPTSDFKDARYAFARAAKVLFGKRSHAWVAVHKSMDAVGISGKWSIPKPRKVVVIPPAKTTTKSTTKIPTTSTSSTKTAQVPSKTSKTKGKSTTKSKSHSSNSKIWIALIIIGAMLIIFVLIKMRPNDKQVVGQFERETDKSDENNKDSINQNIFGHLEALDGTEAIPLNNALLDSEEGLIIGRAHELVHIIMENKDISRRHSRIKLFNSQLYIEDMNSTYGTQVDGVKLSPFKPSKISEQQIVRFAGFSYQLKLG
ncbi:MAG: M4 family metallopeptidase [Gammaproteobacteria bacterium]|nr:M4 family metallopeptidase [Gammaproteobacteria bacterium]